MVGGFPQGVGSKTNLHGNEKQAKPSGVTGKCR